MRRISLYIILVIPFLFLIACQPIDDSVAKQIVSKYKAEFLKPPKKIPSTTSVDAPMLGNGYTGVAISGTPENQVYYVARNDFWRLKSAYNESFPAVLGKVVIDIPDLEGASYNVEQDLYTAKTYSEFSKGTSTVNFKTYVSAMEDLMILEIILTGKEEMQGIISLELPLIGNFPSVDSVGENQDKILWLSRSFEEDVDIPTKSAIALNLLNKSTKPTRNSQPATRNFFTIKPGKKVLIACAFSSNFKSDDCKQAVIDRLRDVKQSDIQDIEKEHEEWWANFWSKSYVDINDSIVEKQYYLSNYNLASFSRDKDFPPSIFGTCITQERPAWNGDYHLNYNHMAPYYGLYSSNHIEQADPYNAPILAMMERGKLYSDKIAGIAEGIMLPVGIGPLGIETTRRNEIMDQTRKYTEEGNEEAGGLFFGQKSNSSYCVVNMALQFYHTYDQEYTERVYPFVKAVAAFWENYLVFEGGRYVIYKDAIHEGSGKNVNPILSLGLVRMVIQTAIDMSEELDVDSDRLKKWQHVLENLSDYTYQQINGKTVFRYSEEGTPWWINNTLGIQHIYPAGQIGLDSDPSLLQVANNTVDVMQRWLDGNGSNSFFPTAVRIGYNPDTILFKMHQYVEHTYPNGFQLGNPHGIENLSTVPNTINEMLCMGHGGVLRVFPVWPRFKDASFHSLRTYGAFLVSSELKDGIVQYVEILSEKGKDCVIQNPWPGRSIILSSNINEDKELYGERFSFNTIENKILTLMAKPSEVITKRPNILFAISDDQGYPHTSANGSKFVKTPGFDRMAEEGVLFQNVYCAVPQCSPNRASILTGRYLWQNYEAGTHASLFPANLKVFTDNFIDGGYHVGSTGKPWAPGQIDKTNRSKNKNLIGKYYNAEDQSEYWKVFQKFLDERDNEEPFFFWYGTYDPHRPYKKGSGLASGKRLEDVDVPPYLPDNDIVRSDFLDYALMIERFDSNLVKMIGILEDMGELDNTLVIVTSDNGMPFPRAKGNAYDAGVRVPMAIRWGDQIPAGHEITDLISHIDFAPTLLNAANLPVYPDIEGESFLEILLNPDSKNRERHRESLFYGRERATSARPNNYGYPVRTIRTEKYELVWNMKPDRSPTGDRFDEAVAARDVIDEIIRLKDENAQTLKMYKDALGQRPEFELHDMEADPSGLINLAYDPEFKEIFDSLFISLKEQLTENGDPRLHGRGDIWESYPRFMGIRKFGGENPAFRAVYNENYVQSGQRIPQYLFDSKHYKAFFEEAGISKEEYIDKLLSKGAIIY